MTSRYWVVSLPVKDSASSLWNRLQEQISKHSFDTPVYRVLQIFARFGLIQIENMAEILFYLVLL